MFLISPASFPLGNHKIISALEIDPQFRTVAAQLPSRCAIPGVTGCFSAIMFIEGLPRDAEQPRNLGL